MSESITLRTYPLREADLIVSFLTRDQGKLRGVANRARKLKSNFGSGLERLSYVEMSYFQRENRELVNLHSCEVIQSQFQLAGDYLASVVLDYLAEVTEQLLPQEEPNEKFFRLLLAMLEYLRQNGETGAWCAATYFSLWAVRLSGFLPDLRLSQRDVATAEEMLRKPISQLTSQEWSKHNTAELRRFLLRQIEEHVERDLQTARYLEAL